MKTQVDFDRKYESWNFQKRKEQLVKSGNPKRAKSKLRNGGFLFADAAVWLLVAAFCAGVWYWIIWNF